ncbi:hypothetical protein [Sporosarcina sp. FA9]|uniref:hypothetical protein n=1 Tax=Sporosarcina sp. FA9 TaxID=3413030 RepID=UPI003F657B1A
MTKDNLKNELLKGGLGQYKIHGVMHSSDHNGPSVLTLIQDMSAVSAGYIVGVYMSRQENEEVIFDNELEIFPFLSHEATVSFANRLPNRTAIELLMMQKGNDFV